MEEDIVASILVPIDGSKNSYKALDYASKLAKSTKASVSLLYVIDKCVDEPGLLDKLEGTAHVDEEIESLPLSRAVDKARGILGDATGIAGEFGLSPHHMIAVGDVPTTIVDVATKYRFGMIVMGTRGHSTFRNKLMGHVSETVAELAPCPVLLAR